MKAKLKLTAVFEEFEEGGYTQGESLEQAKVNLLKAFEFVMDKQSILSRKNPFR